MAPQSAGPSGEARERTSVSSRHHEFDHDCLICVMEAGNSDMKVWKCRKHAAQQLIHRLGSIVGRSKRGNLVARVVECRDCTRNIMAVLSLDVLPDYRLAALPQTVSWCVHKTSACPANLPRGEQQVKCV